MDVDGDTFSDGLFYSGLFTLQVATAVTQQLNVQVLMPQFFQNNVLVLWMQISNQWVESPFLMVSSSFTSRHRELSDQAICCTTEDNLQDYVVSINGL